MRKFYIIEKKAAGHAIHVFLSKKTRDETLTIAGSIHARALPARDVIGALRNDARFASVDDVKRHYA